MKHSTLKSVYVLVCASTGKFTRQIDSTRDQFMTFLVLTTVPTGLPSLPDLNYLHRLSHFQFVRTLYVSLLLYPEREKETDENEKRIKRIKI